MDKNNNNYNNLLMKLGFIQEPSSQQITAEYDIKKDITSSPTSVADDYGSMEDLGLSQNDKNMNKCVNDDKYSKIYNAKLTSSNRDKSKSTYELCNETIKQVEGIFLDKVNGFIDYSQHNSADVKKFVTDIAIRMQVICRCIIRADKEKNDNIINDITKFMKEEYPDFTEDLKIKCLSRLQEPTNVPPNTKAEKIELIELENFNIRNYYHQLNSTTLTDAERLEIIGKIHAAKERIKDLNTPQKRRTYLSPCNNPFNRRRGGKRTKKSYKKSKKANTKKHKKSKKVTFKKNKKTRKH